MTTFIEILEIILPALLVLITAYVILSKTIKNDQDRRRQEAALQNVKLVTPVKLQAYERMVLLLERISPESLVIRVSKADASAQQLHNALLSTIRSEYEHNLSQQIYMSNEAWQMVNNARNSVVRLINGVAAEIPPTASGADLSRQIIEAALEVDPDPCKMAIDFIKAEVGRMI
ncbi:MAG TPA: hypothetical protein PKH02_07710 [Bacteroidales bacterium]|nr:hypothetical protein [Bacteroidales bacterium]HPT12169.1 hypothetical protein [Bacteroidales bacterium]